MKKKYEKGKERKKKGKKVREIRKRVRRKEIYMYYVNIENRL